MSKALVLLASNSKEVKKLNISKQAMSMDKDVDVTFANKEYDYITLINKSPTTSQEARDLGGNMFKKYKSKATEIVFNLPRLADVKEGAALASYEFNKYKTKPEENTLQVEDAGISASVHFARDLITEPGNALYPEEYAHRINETLTPLGVRVRIIYQRELERIGMDMLLSVGLGSENNSAVVIMEHLHGPEGEQPIALVGKGVTFDTGGISLKPGRNMGDMKYDMGGSAAVVGAMHAIADKKLKKNVVGIVGLVENMPDGKAIKPGDVVRSLSGQYVENLNTDAEGRLVLGDILTYVQSEYNPGAIIDLATLTGAIVATLGNEMAGLFTNSDGLEKAIIENGELGGEGYFRMPMGKNWAKMIKSPIADFQNIGGPYGGSTTAAEFLYKFVDKKTAWAHLDIAGMCWSKSGNATTPEGAVGFGVKTLFNFVDNTKLFWFSVDEKMSY
jgi:leucyl aminopeptidase|tara:strand:- start:582 stop:1922 length:1341 start_codon:yes stop_codon:yes gene_type:complete